MKYRPTYVQEIVCFRKLEEQLKETQVAKDELVAQQQELHEMMIRLKIDRYFDQVGQYPINVSECELRGSVLKKDLVLGN